MIKIAISGASGRMGRTLINSVLQAQDLELSCVLDHPGSEYIGTDAGQLVTQPDCGINVAANLKQADFDVLIDFTRPEATLAYLDDCLAQNKAMIIGTTGFDPAQQQCLSDAAQKIKILQAANMSIGVNLTINLMQMAAKAIGESADIEIFEAHHRHKVDAPSGTALAMGQAIAQTLGRDLDVDGVFSRHGHTGERKPDQIGFSVMRAGDIIGDHSAYFALPGERIEISHKASDRNIYASGALQAARWIDQQTAAGLFNMQNVLGLA